MMAVVILLRVLTKMSSGSDGKKLSNLKRFIILRLGEGLTSFNKITVLSFLVKNSKMKLSRVSSFFENTREETISQI